MNKPVLVSVLAVILLLIDWYVFQGVKAATTGLNGAWREAVHGVYWGLTGLTLLALYVYHFYNPYLLGKRLRTALMVGIFANYTSKFFMLLFVLFDDIGRLIKGIYQSVSGAEGSVSSALEEIPRSPVVARLGLAVSSVPLAAIGWGILSGAHDYRIVRRKVHLPNLPKAFEGLRIAQVSDIHAGSFWNKIAVQGGVEMLNREKADLVFFTGDLVNDKATEMRDYGSVFEKVKAPLGVYSVLGNHDYGDYVSWPSQQAKQQNLADLKTIHRQMGWDLLVNEHRMLESGGDRLAILGIENWGAKGHFPRYGRMSEAWQGTEEAAVKLLLSHDPSHWMAEVLPDYKDINLMFSGHTHGMQFGVQLGDFRWSPVQYFYEQWADLYRSGEQYLYVNRGFGYLGFPGRIGIPPEITIIELSSKAA